VELLPKELAQTLPKLYEQDNKGDDAVVYLKFFDPCSYWTWFVLEFDGVDTLFGLVRGHEIEIGYFSLKELQDCRGPLGIGIERDLYFKPTPLRKIQAELNPKGSKMSRAELLKWVNATLHNDEFSTDNELVEYFIKGGLTQQEARKAVSQRDKCLNDIFYDAKI